MIIPFLWVWLLRLPRYPRLRLPRERWLNRWSPMAKAARFEGAFALQLRLGLHRESSPRNGLQPRARNRLGGQLADPVGLLFNPLQGLFDLKNCVLIGGEEAECKVPVEIIRARVGHVEAVAGEFLGGLLGQAVHLPDQLLAQFQQMKVKLVPLRLYFLEIRSGQSLVGH